jgi:4-hydroxy-4-methyl-2-oxoglutarate aldolase
VKEYVSMITIRERPEPRVSQELLDRLRRIPPAAVGHHLDFGFMDVELRPFGRRNFIVCGPALTMRVMAVDSSIVHTGIGMAQPGDVIVIDRNGERKHAAWGEMTSLYARLRGVTAAIVDGPATDIIETEQMEFLVFSRGITPITCKGLAVAGEINTVVQCGGVSVAPGDIILADDNGAVVIPADQVATVVETCEPRIEWEESMRRRLHAGEALGDISRANAKVAAAMESQAQH